MLGPKKLLRPVARQVLDNVSVLAATVVALARISLGILIREHRPHSFQHRLAHKIFGSNQFQPLMLASGFVINGS